MTTLAERIMGEPGTYTSRFHSARRPGASPNAHADLYAVLEEYYFNNDVYQRIRNMSKDESWRDAVRGLRNPAFRSVEFFVAKLWPGSIASAARPEEGALGLLTDNPAIVDPIRRIWGWSQWEQNKQQVVRWGATYGDMVGKVHRDQQRKQVYFEVVNPKRLTEMDQDDRGFVEWCRLDDEIKMPRTGETDLPITTPLDREQTLHHTEVWEKLNRPGAGGGRVRMWVHQKPGEQQPDKLGTPYFDRTFAELRLPTLPIAHAPWRNIGEERGMGAYAHALEKIDDVNRSATRLHQMQFRWGKPWIVMTSGSPGGRPLPPQRIRDERSDDILPVTRREAANPAVVTDDGYLSMPGGSDVKFLVPNLPYGEMLNTINADLLDLEEDMPELAYYRIKRLGGALSGRAVRLLLSDSVDRVIEARGNAHNWMVRMDQIGLSLGQTIDLWDDNIGTFENIEAGPFAHGFHDQEIIALSEAEIVEEEEGKVRSAKGKVELGVPLEIVLQELGYTEAQSKQWATAHAEEQVRIEEETLRRFAAGFDGSEDSGFPNVVAE